METVDLIEDDAPPRARGDRVVAPEPDLACEDFPRDDHVVEALVHAVPADREADPVGVDVVALLTKAARESLSGCLAHLWTSTTRLLSKSYRVPDEHSISTRCPPLRDERFLTVSQSPHSSRSE